jgi:3-deoxy-D-manno-octulosonic-acid transferase
MNFLYDIAINIVGFILRILAIFNKKIKLFVNGRKNVFQNLKLHFVDNDNVIWFHCASLGEFEQSRPIIEKLKDQYPAYKILVTFFSPSGYEIRKDYSFAEVVSYLPLDTRRNARKFIEIVNPKIAVFVKYEFWPNILKELKSKEIETILVSGIFRKEQAFFKWYGSWMKNSLQAFDHFFVQDESSKNLLNNIGFKNITVSGDTRFDRVFEITQQDNYLEFIEKFTTGNQTLVAGSTWPKDEELLINYINNQASDIEKYIIAPHNINPKEIENLKKSITKKTILFSDKDKENIMDAQVLIIDSIGVLTKVYSYASIAYVGGGFGVGIHNILEPSTFGVPIIIGPNHQKFNEAKELIDLDACQVINNASELNSALRALFNNNQAIKNKGKKSREYILKNIGATQKIIDYLKEYISVN